MKVKVTTAVGNFNLSFEADGIKSLMEGISEYMSVLGNCKCGKCKSENVVPECRSTTEGHKYYAMVCMDCERSYLFGQHKNGTTLFPKDRQWLRYDERRSSNDSQESTYE